MYYITLLTHISGKQYIGRSSTKELPIEQRVYAMGYKRTSELNISDFTFSIIDQHEDATISRIIRIQYIDKYNTRAPNGFNDKVGVCPKIKSANIRKRKFPKLSLVTNPDERAEIIERRGLSTRLRVLTKLDKHHWDTLPIQELRNQLESLISERKSRPVKPRVKRKKVSTPWKRAFMRLKVRTTILGTDIGYTALDLKQHLESLFHSNMSWDNHGELWQVDHIKPIRLFTTRGIFTSSIINALSNIQPILLEEHKLKNKQDAKEVADLKSRLKELSL